jgi:hypothetical protein
MLREAPRVQALAYRDADTGGSRQVDMPPRDTEYSSRSMRFMRRAMQPFRGLRLPLRSHLLRLRWGENHQAGQSAKYVADALSC